MSNNKITQSKISYEPEADVLRVEVSQKPIDYAAELGNIIVHFTKDGMPVYLEILEASKFLKKSEKILSQAGVPAFSR